MKKLILAFILLNLILITSTFIGAFLNARQDLIIEQPIGDVGVEIIPYFIKSDGSKETDNIFYEFNGLIKEGVIGVNITNPSDAKYFTKFGVDIVVHSNVKSFIRVAVYEQISLTYVTGGVISEIATTQESYSPFNYNLYEPASGSTPEKHGFYDNRLFDGYFYYTNLVVGNGDATQPLTIPLIDIYNENQTYQPYDGEYRLQLGFIVEVVQFYGGPENNWGLPKTPWNDSIWPREVSWNE